MNFNKNLYTFMALLFLGAFIYNKLWGSNKSTHGSINVNVYHCTTNNPYENCSLLKRNWTVHSETPLSLDRVIPGN